MRFRTIFLSVMMFFTVSFARAQTTPVVHDTVFVIHDTVYVSADSSPSTDYYNYYCSGIYWNSYDCNGYLNRSTIIYIPRYRTVPIFAEHYGYHGGYRYSMPVHRYPFIVPDRVRPVPGRSPMWPAVHGAAPYTPNNSRPVTRPAAPSPRTNAPSTRPAPSVHKP